MFRNYHGESGKKYESGRTFLYGDRHKTMAQHSYWKLRTNINTTSMTTFNQGQTCYPCRGQNP
jgi:hypothetical protein